MHASYLASTDGFEETGASLSLASGLTFQLRKSSISGHKARQHGGDEFSRIDHLTTLTRKRFCICNEITMHRRRQLRTYFDRLVVWKLSYF